MKLTLNSIETLKYILRYVDNPQNSDKKRLLKGEDMKARDEYIKKTEKVTSNAKKEVNKYIKEYNVCLAELQRKLKLQNIRQELIQDKINNNKELKKSFNAMIKVQEKVGKTKHEIKLSKSCQNLCAKLVKEWDENIGWEEKEVNISQELLKNLSKSKT